MRFNIKILFLFLIISGIFILSISEAGPQTISFNLNLSENSSIDRGLFYSSSIVLEVNTERDAVCKYSIIKNIPYSNMEGVFDENYGIVHRKILTGLEDGIHKYYIKCLINGTGFGNELEGIFRTSSPVSAKISFSEEPPLKAGKHKIKLTTSKIVVEKPELSYSFDSSSYEPIALFGSGKEWEGYIIIPESIREAIGSFRFIGRGISGIAGTEITKNNVFLVDTEKPQTISTIEATGYEGQIKLKWYIDEDVEEFNIYKSKNPNVDYTNFYETHDDNEYIDNDVDKGKTYYYRVSAIDEAGNVASLSKEVHATALFNDNTIQDNGLDVELRGEVDNFITEINLLLEDINDIELSLSSKNDKESKIIDDLKLKEEINNAKRELNTLKGDVEKFKQQDLTKDALDGKIDSSRLRLNIIRKKIPEDIIILQEKTLKREIEEQDIDEAILEYDVDLNEDIYKDSVKSSLDLIKEKEFSINSNIYIIEILYMDGTKKETTFIKDNINSKAERDKDSFILCIIPKNIADTSDELDIKNLNYEIVKSDPVISFSLDTKEIKYTLNKKINIESIEEIKIVPINILQDEAGSSDGIISGITGFFVFENGISKSIVGVIILVLVIIALLFYFLYIKKRKKSSNKEDIMENIKEFRKLKKQGKDSEAENIYELIKKQYKNLGKKDKKQVYKKIKDF
jgi:hypothetical protein